jgi:hypothetical protein
MYSMEIKRAEKIFYVTAKGMFTQEEGIGFITDLKKNIQAIDARDYYLVLDTTELKASSQDALEGMQVVMQIYSNTPFKDRFCIVAKSAVTNSQIKRVGKEEKLDEFIKPVESLDDVIKLVR